MKNKTKGEILVVVFCLLNIVIIWKDIYDFLTSILPLEMWWVLSIVGIGLGYIMSQSDS